MAAAASTAIEIGLLTLKPSSFAASLEHFHTGAQHRGMEREFVSFLSGPLDERDDAMAAFLRLIEAGPDAFYRSWHHLALATAALHVNVSVGQTPPNVDRVEIQLRL